MLFPFDGVLSHPRFLLICESLILILHLQFNFLHKHFLDLKPDVFTDSFVEVAGFLIIVFVLAMFESVVVAGLDETLEFGSVLLEFFLAEKSLSLALFIEFVCMVILVFKNFYFIIDFEIG